MIICIDIGNTNIKYAIYDNDELSERIQFLYKDDIDEFDGFISDFISKNINEVFFFGGFLGEVGKILQLYNKKGGNKSVIITEKPSIRPSKYCNNLVRVLKMLKTRIVYGKAYRKVKNSIKAILVTGEKGVKLLQSIGITQKILYNFMYTHIEEQLSPIEVSKSNIVRFVYVGRFNYLNRGMDSLMYTFDKLHRDNWKLDLVGGYGEEAKEVIAWADKKQNVSY